MASPAAWELFGPAGYQPPVELVHRPLSRVRRRIVGFFSDAPILFLGIVLGVALTFQVVIGWAKRQARTDEVPAAAAPPGAR